MKYRNRILLIVIALMLIISVCFIAVVIPSHKQSKGTPSTTHASTDAVTLSNMSDFSTWTYSKNLSAIEQALYEQVTRYTTNATPTYTATIRQSSFKTTYSDYDNGSQTISIPTVHYIVDIPEVKQSYIVDESGGKGYPYDILHITCPSKNELKYGDFGCTNEEQ